MKFMTGTYDYRLVALSLIVAIVASYTALILAERVNTSRPQHAGAWLAGGAFAMGTGIWAMHFIAMLAFSLPMAMGYDIFLTLISWLMGVIASAVALYLVSRTTLSTQSLFLGAGFMAVGIVGMHYTGMYAMRMDPGIVYFPALVAASVAIAFAVSLAALLLGFRLRNDLSWAGLARKMGAAILMGLAITGMHYTAMAAARFPMDSTSAAILSLDPIRLATLVGAATLLLLGTLLIISMLDQRRDAESAESMDSLRRSNAELRLRQLYNPQTQLPNRNQLLALIEQQLERWRQDETRFAVIHIGLHGFVAPATDAAEHRHAGLLKRIAHTLEAAAQPGDAAAHVDGGDFIMLVSDLDNRDPIWAICAHLSAEISELSTDNMRLSTIMGSAVCPDDGTDASFLVMAAERAMHTAKRANMNYAQHYLVDTPDEQAVDRVVQVELAHAINHGGIVPYYLPYYDPRSRRMVGAQALVRWQQRDADVITPDYFMPVAEKYDLVSSLERCMLAAACANIRQWLDDGLHVPPIALAMSAARLKEADLPEQIHACLQQHDLAPQHVRFEIDEAVIMDDVDATMQTLQRLSEDGVGICMNNFGAGRTSLPWLGRLPVCQLRLADSFVSELSPDNANHIRVIRAIVDLAHDLGITVVAGGVQTQEQMRHLQEIQCDEVQSLMLCRPITARTFGERLRGATGPARISSTRSPLAST